MAPSSMRCSECAHLPCWREKREVRGVLHCQQVREEGDPSGEIVIEDAGRVRHGRGEKRE